MTVSIFKRALLLLASLVVAGSPALAATPPTPAEMQTAGDALAAKVIAATEQGVDVPRLRDPANAVLIRTAFSREGMRAMPAELQTVLPMCRSLQQAFSSMVKWSAGPRFLGYQDELTLGMAGGDLCIKRMFRAADAFFTILPTAERTSVRRDGFKQMQDGAQGMIVSLLGGLSDQSVAPANRALLLSALLEDADGIAVALTPAQRAEVRAKILATAQKVDAGSREQLMKLAQVYARTGCGALCTFSQEK